MTPEAFVRTLGRHRTTAIVRANEPELAAAAMAAAIAGGIRIVEFTLTTPGAYELIADFSRPRGGEDEVVVGAGTVLELADLERAITAGARFIVSPVFDPVLVRAAIDANVAVLPGVHTPTEMLQAHRLGAPLLKLFPAPAGGPAWLRSVLAPLPNLRVVPTNGVALDNVDAWLDAGAWAVGLVADLFRPAWLAARDFDAITAHARALRSAVQAHGPHPHAA
ncbi:MAG: bifunctional 4-hydroxy-2-oxoglutarate aldolase/2-dehydro-3-deoxy-phosphogluconate aldolase [Myxococcales bacterium]|nr:bifunctional 4-hydroxy-2-oxoglutarate aldolase/2-dehydro-3-deoxy-phosphogluconate aldolase [Myxococcales bacterium]